MIVWLLRKCEKIKRIQNVLGIWIQIHIYICVRAHVYVCVCLYCNPIAGMIGVVSLCALRNLVLFGCLANARKLKENRMFRGFGRKCLRDDHCFSM